MGYVKLVFFILFSFLCQLAFCSSLPHLCPKDQALGLLQFKHMFTINHDASDHCLDITGQSIQSYPKTLSWNKSTDCCSWDGVYCDETTGQVIELNLTCSKLQGKFHFNSSLFQLSNLKWLDLSDNDFSGSLISPKFGELSSLMHLDLSYSSFTGLIPAEISRLSKLHVLRIRSINQYDLRFGPHNFELLLKNLTQLRELDLYDTNISSTIPLKFSSYLTNLGLSYTQIYGILPEGVFHLSNLESLDLSNNPQLTVRFPTTKWNSSASLMKLCLNGVNATGRIPESFGHLTSLRILDLFSSNLSGSIPKPLWNLTNIEVLDLAYNHLEGPISDLFRFGKLKRLSLENNNLDGQLEFLSFTRWTQFEFLDCSFNSLTGPIPSNVSGMQNLQHLYLSSNHLNGTIPSWIFSLPSLTDLDVSGNHFSGNIQEFKSKTLFSVILKQNQLQGPIPKALLNQRNLYYLLLSHNNLRGQIASTICNLKTLQVLDLGSNNLEGTIPLCLGEMSELPVLDLSNNSLSGTINTTFSINNQLRVIKFDGNKLEGKVPRSLINCVYLEVVDLGNNELSDTFPKWLGALLFLKILNLRSNKFYGPIKDSWTDNLFDQILVIDLSSNRFSGDLPVSLFENFQAMKIIDENSGTREYVAGTYYTSSLIVTTKGQELELPRVLTTEIIINLSRNRFEGHIPSIIGDLIGLRTLNLSHNRLEGHIPASLHQLSVLESLDLSSNKISGEIPQQFVSLTSLEVLNLSHNHLVGCIPKGKQFDTFENSSYQGNDELRGLPLSKDCGGDEGVPQATAPFGLDQEEEGDSVIISWQAVLMGYGCGLVIGLSIIYIMQSTQYPAWFSRMDVELEHKILTRMKRHKKRH